MCQLCERPFPSGSYQLLGILQGYAPNGPAQEQCSEIYRTMQMDGLDEHDVSCNLASILADGLLHGNWPWA